MKELSKESTFQDLANCNLLPGGLFSRACERVGLAHARRRVTMIALFTWLPLLLLSALEGLALSKNLKIPFLLDIAAHTRFLVALPALLAAEMLVHNSFNVCVHQFMERDLIVPEDRSKFNSALYSLIRMRDSFAIEILLVFLAYSLGHWVWMTQTASTSTTWYASSGGLRHANLTWAGWWFALVSIPIFQFVLVRWYIRILAWAWFLWRVSRLNLRLTATHPDGAGGLSFLGTGTHAFMGVLFAQGALLSGLIANGMFFDERTLLSYKMDAIALVLFFLVVVLGPLLVFAPNLAAAKRSGRRAYGTLASQYVQGFENKWISKSAQHDEALIGSSDIQSLADLANSYAVVKEMRLVPFNKQTVLTLTAATLAPLFPLVLTIVPLEEIVSHVLKILF